MFWSLMIKLFWNREWLLKPLLPLITRYVDYQYKKTGKYDGWEELRVSINISDGPFKSYFKSRHYKKYGNYTPVTNVDTLLWLIENKKHIYMRTYGSDSEAVASIVTAMMQRREGLVGSGDVYGAAYETLRFKIPWDDENQTELWRQVRLTDVVDPYSQFGVNK